MVSCASTTFYVRCVFKGACTDRCCSARHECCCRTQCQWTHAGQLHRRFTKTQEWSFCGFSALQRWFQRQWPQVCRSLPHFQPAISLVPGVRLPLWRDVKGRSIIWASCTCGGFCRCFRYCVWDNLVRAQNCTWTPNWVDVYSAQEALFTPVLQWIPTLDLGVCHQCTWRWSPVGIGSVHTCKGACVRTWDKCAGKGIPSHEIRRCCRSTDHCVKKHSFYSQCRPKSRQIPPSWPSGAILTCKGVFLKPANASRW